MSKIEGGGGENKGGGGLIWVSGGLDPVSKPAIGGTVVGQIASIKTNGPQPKL